MSVLVCGQSPTFLHFSTRDGLNSNKIYSLYEDSNGYLWIGTEKGAMRYNGAEFQEVLSSARYADAEVYGISEDRSGDIWFETRYSRMFSYQNGNIVPAYFAKQLTELVGYDSHFISTDIQNDSTFDLSVLRYGSYNVRSDTIFSEQRDDSIRIQVDTKGHWYYSQSKGSREMVLYSLKDRSGKIWRGEIEQSNPLEGGNLRGIRRSIDPVFAKETRVYKWMNDHWKAIDMEHAITALYEDSKGHIWVGMLFNGLARLDKDLNVIEHNIPLGPNVTVSALMMDRAGQFWIGTESNGLYKFLTNSSIEHYSSEGKSQSISGIASSDSILYVAFYDSQLLMIDKNTGRQEILDLEDQFKFRSGIDDIEYSTRNNTLYLTGKDHHAYYISDKNELVFLSPDPVTYAIRLHKTEGKILTTGGHGIFVLDQDIPESALWVMKGQEILYRQHARQINDVILDQDRFLLAGQKGLFQVDEERQVQSLYPTYFENKNIEHIIQSEQELIASVHGEGIYVMRKDTVLHLGVEEGFPSNSVRALLLHNNDLFVGTARGLSVVDFAEMAVKSNHFKGENVDQIHVDGDMLWVGSDNGAYSVHLSNLLEKRTNIQAKVDRIIGDGRHFELSDNGSLELKTRVNELYIDLDAVDLSIHGPFQFRYRLLGQSDTWRSSESGQLEFIDLDPGDYTLQISVFRGNQSEDIPIKEISFTQEPRFYERIIFKLGIALLLIGVMYTLVRMNKIRVERKLKQTLDMHSLTQQAIKARLDPHFIFNSLNSLKFFIKTDQKSKADTYVSNFAKLMRSNIEYAKDDVTILEREIELLSSYCKLEEMRLEGTLEFHVDCATDVNLKKTLIPSMTLQPLVENAIWHGLRAVSGPKRLKIEITRTNEQLIITVEDNGRGLPNGKADLDDTEEGHAIYFIRERLKLFSKIEQEEYTLQIQDRMAWGSSESGTLCTLSIPHRMLSP